jgi:hypothetical protein
VRQQFGNRRIAPRTQAQQAYVVAAAHGKFRLANGLRRAAHDARDFHQVGHGVVPGISGAQLLHRKFQDRFEQAEARVADFELRGVYAHRHATGARGQVVAREGALAALIELACGGQRQRVRGDRHAFPQLLAPTHRL